MKESECRMNILKKIVPVIALCLLINFCVPKIGYANPDGWIGPFTNLDASFGMDDNYNLYGAEYCIHNGKKIRYKDNIKILQSCMDHQNKKLWVVYNSPGNIAWINTEDLTINYLPTITPAHNFFKLMVKDSQVYYTRFYTSGYAKGAIAKIYKYNGSAWIELAEDMKSGDTYVTTYWGTALNASGTLFIVGGYTAENNSYYPVKQYINNSWVFRKNASMIPSSTNAITKDFIVGKDDYFWLDIDGGIGLVPGFYSQSLNRITNSSVIYPPKDYYLIDDGSVILATLPQGGYVQVVKTPPNSTTGCTMLYQSENTIPLDTPIKIVGTSSKVGCYALVVGSNTYLYGSIPEEISAMHISTLAGDAKIAAQAAQSAANVAATAATNAKTSADNVYTELTSGAIATKISNAETAATNAKTAADTAANRTIYKDTNGTEYSAARWAYEAYILAKQANSAATAAKDNVMNNSTSNIYTNASSAASNTQALDGATTKSAAQLALEAKTQASSAVTVLNDPNKGLSKTFDKADTTVTQLTSTTAGTIRSDLTVTKTSASNAASDASTAKTQATTAATQATTAASKASTAVTELQSNTYGLNKIKTDTGTAVINTQALDGANTKSAAQLAKEARDKVTQLTQVITPVIHSVKGQNGATCTTGNTFTVVISASNAIEYRARVLGTSTWYTSTGSGADVWGTGNTISLGGISSTGAKTIEVQARSSVTGTPANDSITIFKI